MDLKIPEKVRLLIWSAYQNVLPSKDNLRRRHVEVDPCCPVCGVDMESLIHCFKDCVVARAVWLGSQVGLRASEVQVTSFGEFFEVVAGMLSHEQLELFCYLCWLLWSNRNEAVWHARQRDPKQIIEHAVQFRREFNEAQGQPSARGGHSTRRGDNRWVPPKFPMVKLNVDGAVFEQQRAYGIGAVIRDEKGQVMAALQVKGYGCVSPEAVEASSLRRALAWAKELGFKNLEVECDCRNVVEMVNKGGTGIFSELGVVISDCISLMTDFQVCLLQHVHREKNMVAHILAKGALAAEEERVWIDETPQLIADVALYEKP